MRWTVSKTDENGQDVKILSGEFDIQGFDNLDQGQFRLIKYLDPYGDLTISRTQLDDLILDLRQLKAGQVNIDQIAEILELIEECRHEPHAYMKFYGD